MNNAVLICGLPHLSAKIARHYIAIQSSLGIRPVVYAADSTGNSATIAAEHGIHTAQKKETTNKPWAGICACLWKGRIYITDFYMNWHEYPDGERAVVSLAEKWNFGREPHALLIEDKSTGSTLIQRIRSEEHLAIKGFSVIGIKPDANLDKIGRMTTEAPMIAGGRVYLPESAPWLPELEELLMSFPQSEFMDPIDALSQLLMWVRTTGISYYDRSIEDGPAHE